MSLYQPVGWLETISEIKAIVSDALNFTHELCVADLPPKIGPAVVREFRRAKGPKRFFQPAFPI